VLVGLALFAGCISPSTGSSGMPLWVAISAEIEGGEQATILVEFVAPEEPPSLRYGETSLQVESPYPNPAEGIHLAVAGAGRGFSIDETEGGVFLNLPHRSRSIPIFGPETTLVDVVWLDELPLSVQQEVDENFQLIERIRILPNPSRVDGDLSDWSGNRALPIDSSSNILSGAEQWSGSRDASFGVAAHLHRGRLEVGVRVRDDDVLLERDHLEIETEYGIWSFPLKESGVYSLADGAEVAFTERSGFGVGLEFGVPMAGNIPQIDQFPVIVRYLDVDNDDQTGSPVVISSAPSMDILLRSTPL
jgi:hypothetical protein